MIVVEAKDLRRKLRVLVFIPGQKEDKVTVKARFNRQNPILNMENFLIISKNEEKEEKILAFFIEECSFKVLCGSTLKAYYKLGIVTLKVLTYLGTDDKSSTSKPRTQ